MKQSPTDAVKRLVDQRIYDIAPRKMGAFLKAFDELALPVLLETLGHPIGFYVTQVGALNRFVQLWGFDDLTDYEQRCTARDNHPGAAAYAAATDGLIQKQEIALIRHVDFSTLASFHRIASGTSN